MRATKFSTPLGGIGSAKPQHVDCRDSSSMKSRGGERQSLGSARQCNFSCFAEGGTELI